MESTINNYESNNIKVWLRWLAVLPAILVGIFIGGVIAYIANLSLISFLGIYESNQGVALILSVTFWIYRSMFQTLFAMFLVWKIAPNHKSITASIAGLLLIVVSAIYMALSWDLETVISSTTVIASASGLSFLYIKVGDNFNPFRWDSDKQLN